MSRWPTRRRRRYSRPTGRPSGHLAHRRALHDKSFLDRHEIGGELGLAGLGRIQLELGVEIHGLRLIELGTSRRCRPRRRPQRPRRGRPQPRPGFDDGRERGHVACRVCAEIVSPAVATHIAVVARTGSVRAKRSSSLRSAADLKYGLGATRVHQFARRRQRRPRAPGRRRTEAGPSLTEPQAADATRWYVADARVPPHEADQYRPAPATAIAAPSRDALGDQAGEQGPTPCRVIRPVVSTANPWPRRFGSSASRNGRCTPSE